MTRSATARLTVAAAVLAGVLSIGIGCSNGPDDFSRAAAIPTSSTIPNTAPKRDSGYCKKVEQYRAERDLNIDGAFDDVAESPKLVKSLLSSSPDELEDDLKLMLDYVDKRFELRLKPVQLAKLKRTSETPEFIAALKHILNYTEDKCGVTVPLE